MLDTFKKKKLQDLPFGKDDVGTRFVTLVIIMMTALATLALGGAEIILSLRGTWVDAINGQITIEIPAVNPDGKIRSAEELNTLAHDIDSGTQMNGADIKQIQRLSRQQVAELIEPWIGPDTGNRDLPLPVLVALTFDENPTQERIEQITKTVHEIDPAAIVETHQTWLDDLRRFSGVLLMASVFMAFAVIACCILCVSGAVKSQLASHQADIDLLHLMGATDDYIGAQFVRVVATDVGRAAMLGVLIGIVFLKIGGVIAGGLQAAMIPGFSWSLPVWLSFLSLPLIVTSLCFVAARVTVLQTLEKMP
ncbi:MAG TPA: FtsX-like permease family protein [Alphaproteobacteria bacterium]